MKLLKHQDTDNNDSPSAFEQRLQHLTSLAKALASEIENLQAEASGETEHDRQIHLGNEGIDFYHEVESYEIELITAALNHCGGNQTHAAKLLRLKGTTLNAKMKHYGLNPVRSIAMHQRQSK